MLRKYQGARISVSGGTDISGASTGGGGRGGGGGGGGGSNRLSIILIQGPDIEQLQDYTDAADGQGQDDQRRRRRRHQLRADAAGAAHRRRSRARGRPRRRHRHAVHRPCARWSAARRSRSSRTATISSASGCGSTSRSATIRRRWATCFVAGVGRPAWCKVSDVAHLTSDIGPASIDRYNRQRQISVNANLDRAEVRSARCCRRRRATRSSELHLKAGLSGGVRRQRADAEPRRRTTS